MGNNSVPKFSFLLSRFPVYRGSVLGRFYCTIYPFEVPGPIPLHTVLLCALVFRFVTAVCVSFRALLHIPAHEAAAYLHQCFGAVHLGFWRLTDTDVWTVNPTQHNSQLPSVFGICVILVIEQESADRNYRWYIWFSSVTGYDLSTTGTMYRHTRTKA
jgi:hypothetical protein